MHALTHNDRETDGRCSFHYRISEIILLSPDKLQTNKFTPPLPLSHFLTSFLVADAYCLLDLYSALSSNPARFGLPADLRSISSSQSEKSADKTQKGKQTKQKKQTLGKEVRDQLPFLS